MIVWFVVPVWIAAVVLLTLAFRRPAGDASWWCRRCRHPVAGVGRGDTIAAGRVCPECGADLDDRSLSDGAVRDAV